MDRAQGTNKAELLDAKVVVKAHTVVARDPTLPTHGETAEEISRVRDRQAVETGAHKLQAGVINDRKTFKWLSKAVVQTLGAMIAPVISKVVVIVNAALLASSVSKKVTRHATVQMQIRVKVDLEAVFVTSVARKVTSYANAQTMLEVEVAEKVAHHRVNAIAVTRLVISLVTVQMTRIPSEAPGINANAAMRVVAGGVRVMEKEGGEAGRPRRQVAPAGGVISSKLKIRVAGKHKGLKPQGGVNLRCQTQRSRTKAREPAEVDGALMQATRRAPVAGEQQN